MLACINCARQCQWIKQNTQFKCYQWKGSSRVRSDCGIMHKHWKRTLITSLCHSLEERLTAHSYCELPISPLGCVCEHISRVFIRWTKSIPLCSVQCENIFFCFIHIMAWYKPKMFLIKSLDYLTVTHQFRKKKKKLFIKDDDFIPVEKQNV